MTPPIETMNELRNAENFDEGLGTVYERFMLNDYFDRLLESHAIANCLEVPLYGMSGLTGINSVSLAMKGCNVVMVDNGKENVREAKSLWDVLSVKGEYDVLWHEDFSRLPFRSESFDLVWNFAALWHVESAGLLLNEMARVSSNLVLVFVPNSKQIGYPFRKYILDREFFKRVDESWINLKAITSHLEKKGLKAIDEGFIDIPLWPDTAFPIKSVFRKMGIKKGNGNGNKSYPQASKGIWNWDIMSYYRGNNPELRSKIKKLSFLEKNSIPGKVKLYWAHHAYRLYKKTEEVYISER